MLIKSAIQPILENATLRREVADFMADLYRRVDTAADQVQFTCKNCKTCCDFDASGLNLFAGNLEFAYFLMNVKVKSIPTITANCCPFLDPATGCTVREFRPLGCRTYFCTPPAGYDEQTLYENAIGEVKIFIQNRNLPYGYTEWLGGLKEFLPGVQNHRKER
jgi:Fe-S-cluster containining protein